VPRAGQGRRALWLAAIAATMVCAAPARASDEAVLSPLAISPHKPADPVRAADGRFHLAYELFIANRAEVPVTVERIEPLVDRSPFGPPLEGNALAARMRIDGREEPSTTIPGGAGATVFMDVTYRSRRRQPDELAHRFTLTLGSGETIVFTGVPERVRDSRPVELETSPLRGENWVAANGCCTLNAHRAATLAIG
jgi:hypothetical protein